MHRSTHGKNTVRYYLIVIIFLAFLFFSNDFGLLNVQKTAIVMAVGIDREENTFIVTSQIAIPKSSSQGKATETVQLVSRGGTVAQTFEQINAKTGWYPKLVFCNLILLGEKTAEKNVFDALDFFLRDEYLSDNCLVATCDGVAKDILDATAVVDQSTSVAIGKVLSDHASRVGTTMPSTLREFSIGYYSESKSGYLPVVALQAQQEEVGGSASSDSSDSSSVSGSSDSSGASSQSGEGGDGQKKEGRVFSARETALFVDGKRVETLTKEETFAFSAATGKLRLAPYTVERKGKTCTLSVKRNDPKIKLDVGKNGDVSLKIKIAMTSGIMDLSSALPVDEVSDVGDVPMEFFTEAKNKLTGEIHRVFEKSQAVGCDLFGVRERIVKYEKRSLKKHAERALENAVALVEVTFQNVR